MGQVINFQDYKNGVDVMTLHEQVQSSMDTSYYNDNCKQLLKMVLFFTSKSNHIVYKTKLNKLLFYSQFLFYKEYGKALVNEDFVKDYYGPVLNHLDDYLEAFKEKELIEVVQTPFGEVIKAKVRIMDENYGREEVNILERVLNKFDNFSSRGISDYSHKEVLWKKPKYKQVINIREAYLLNEL